MLAVGSSSVTAELRLPLSELQAAFGRELELPQVTGSQNAALHTYLLDHVEAVAPDGRRWTIATIDLAPDAAATPVDVVAHLRMTPPEGAPLRQFKLHYDVVAREVPNHVAIVAVRHDWDRAVFAAHPEVIGTIRYLHHDLVVDRTGGNWWSGVRGLFGLGMSHIAAGADHMLFLLALMLPAPLCAVRGRWGGRDDWRSTLWRLAKIVSAFTLGHSLTLSLAALDLVRLPAAPVEVLIAVSIAVSALHAWRPLFAGREPWVACGFGLVHGLAFASAMSELGLDGRPLAVALVAFNLGIEAMQAIVVVAVVPSLLVLARSPIYAGIRKAGAAFTGAAALAWIGERSFGWPNPLAGPIEAMVTRADWLASAFAVGALLVAVQGARRHRVGVPDRRVAIRQFHSGETTR